VLLKVRSVLKNFVARIGAWQLLRDQARPQRALAQAASITCEGS
jgi:hypothetical protein